MNGSKATRELKIAYIGGGSRGWARKLMVDLALCPELSGEVALYDIDMGSARLNERFGAWVQSRPEALSAWSYRAAGDLGEALRGADFVVISIQPGTLEVMGAEIAAAERAGMWFPVGDTAGAPGLIRGLRAATIYEGLARAVAAECPKAWVINYTNPMTVCTRALTRVEPALKAFGCCHEVFGTQARLAEIAASMLDLDQAPARSEIEVNVLGVNHFTLVDRASYRGEDLLALLPAYIEGVDGLRPRAREEVLATGDWFQDLCRVKWSLFTRWAILPAAGDRHLVEFLPGFTRSPEELFGWGVVRTPVSFRIARWSEAPLVAEETVAGRRPFSFDASGEEGVAQMRALLGLGDLVTNVNVENRGQMGGLPAGAVVETNARFARDRIEPLAAGSLPPGPAEIVARHAANQEAIVEAALSKDRDLAFSAFYNDPANSLPLDESWALFKEMLSYSAPWLPGWKID
jgi:alpha-galactosidase/6-phospho-beta-glucosidase family protein